MLTEQQIKELKEFFLEQQRDLATMANQSKDRETSSLHREILNKLNTYDVWKDELNLKLDNLDKFVQRSEPIIKIAENLSWSGKGLLAIFIAIGIITGGIIGLKEITSDLFK